MISKTKTSFVKSSRNTKSAGNVFMTIKKKKSAPGQWIKEKRSFCDMRDISRYLRPNKGGRGTGGGEGLQQKLTFVISRLFGTIQETLNRNIIKSSPYHAVKECLTRDIQFMAQKKKKKVSKILSDYKKEKETMAAAV